MSETDTYYKYHRDRVLIATARMYRPMFSPATVYLTGAQVEMLRNMTQYLNRPNTYVEEYEADKYKTPNASQFDGIQAIVSDLEEKLMGNPNTLWGFDDTYEQMVQEDSDVAGSFYMQLGTVPANEVWRVEGVGFYRTTNAAQSAQVQVYNGAATVSLEGVDMPLAGIVYNSKGVVTLQEGYCIKGVFFGATIGETCILIGWGYKMAVP